MDRVILQMLGRNTDNNIKPAVLPSARPEQRKQAPDNLALCFIIKIADAIIPTIK